MDIEIENIIESLISYKWLIITVGLALWYSYQWIKAHKLIQTVKLLYNHEEFNDSLYLIGQLSIYYTFRHQLFSNKSREIFNTLKNVYDYWSTVKIPAKRIIFSFYELEDNDNLKRNIVSFLDYYRDKNGIKIIIRISESKIKQEIIDYAENIEGVNVPTALKKVGGDTGNFHVI